MSPTTTRFRHPARPARGGVLLKMLLCLACVLAMVALAWMLFLPALVSSVLEKRTGCAVRVESIYANPFNGRLDVRGLVLENPPGFGPGEFLDLRRLTAAVDMPSLLGRRLEIEAGSVDIARLTVSTDGRGTNSLDLIARRLAWLPEAKRAGSAAPAPAGEARAPRKFAIHRLDVALGEVVIVDDGAQPPSHRTVTLNFRHHYEAIMNGGQFLKETLTALQQGAGEATFSALLPGAAGRALDDAAPKKGEE